MMENQSVSERETFRIFFWQAIVPLLGLPVVMLFLLISPFASSWTLTTWAVAGCVGAVAIVFYLARSWSRAAIDLTEDGISYYSNAGYETAPWEHVRKVKRIGRYRVRLCLDWDQPGWHRHVAFDLFNPDDFADAILDWYAEQTGHELPEETEHAAAA